MCIPFVATIIPLHISPKITKILYVSFIYYKVFTCGMHILKLFHMCIPFVAIIIKYHSAELLLQFNTQFSIIIVKRD